MPAVPEARSVPEAVARYKRILAEVLDNRPSGARLRLANTLRKNRSFISQIANPSYAIPIPSQHIPAIFEVCHFSQSERQRFLAAYADAHPRRHPANRARLHWRSIAVSIPDLGDPKRNRALDELVADFARKLGDLAEIFPTLHKEEKTL